MKNHLATTGSNMLPLSDLLPTEVYANLGKQILQYLFDETFLAMMERYLILFLLLFNTLGAGMFN